MLSRFFFLNFKAWWSSRGSTGKQGKCPLGGVSKPATSYRALAQLAQSTCFGSRRLSVRIRRATNFNVW